MKLLAAEEFGVGARIVVELDSHVALAEIRYSYLRDDKFVLGAKKHNMLARLTLADDASWDETLRALTGTPEPFSIAEPELMEETEAETVDSEAADSNTDHRLEIENGIGIEHGTEIEPFIEPSAPIPVQTSDLDVAPTYGPLGRKMEILTDEEAAELYAKAFPKAPKQAQKPPEPPPQPASKPSELPSLSSVIVAVSVACVLALTVAEFAWGPLLERSKVSKTTAPVAPSVAPAVLDVARGRAGVSSAAKRRVVILSHAPNWLSTCSDTNEKYEKMLGSGDTLEFYFDKKAVIRMGNSGASEISVDGKALGAIGGSGSPRVITVDSTGFQYATGLPADGSADCPVK